ncbi:hypothetical protein PYW08_008314 [Mythimna loreyi]|uniref:Uncharacterized protein n=1 Tax=Mythimna loreyi TaxID=667449 RepID=A0ACC2QB51_9NEOP|nr:hypothetical protein PYW08_008314 [Mythimna loreyi]
MIYPDLESARRPLPHSEEVPVPTYCSTSESSQEPNPSQELNPSQENNKVNSDSDFEGSNFTEPKPFTQKELNDLIRDLELSKESAEVLASRLKEKNLLATGTKQYRYRAGVFSGVRSFSGVATGGTRICGVYACTGDTRETCGLRFSSYVPDSTAIFQELVIEASMPTPSLFADLDTNNAVVYPVSSKVSIMPLESKEFEYTTSKYLTNTIFTMTLKNTSAELLTFAVWGRRFATDGQTEDPPLSDDEGDVTPAVTTEGVLTEITTTGAPIPETPVTDGPTTEASTTPAPGASAVHLLSRVLFASLVALICYSQF